MKHVIFISYRRSDGAWAARLRDALEQPFKGSVFLDINDVGPGVDFLEHTRASIRSAKVLVVVIGKTWLVNTDGRTELGDKNDYVTDEIYAALDNGIPIVPVLVDDATMPHPEELPSRLRPLARRNALRISHANFTADVQPLIDTMYQHLDYSPPTRLEKIIESTAVDFTFDLEKRDKCAIWSPYVAATGWSFGIGAVFFQVDLLAELFAGTVLVAALLGIVGLNSKMQRRHGIIGLALSAAALSVVIVLALLV